MWTKERTMTNNEIVFARENPWMPRVIRKNGELYIELAGGADANHDPRVFTFPISKTHLEIIRDNINRHLVLWSVLLPLWEAAGSQGELDEAAAVALLDPVLFRPEQEVETILAGTPWDKRLLIAQHASIELLDEGKIFAALETAQLTPDWNLVWEYDAKRNREREGIVLAPIDEALLKYTGRYLFGGKKPTREPQDVEPSLLPTVLEVIATAEQACLGMELPAGWGKGAYDPADKAHWNKISDKVEEAVHATYPELVNESVRTVSFLMCSEAADRANGKA